MYPKIIQDAERSYFYEDEYFKDKFHFAHAFLHNDCRYGMHSHECYEINIIANGQGRHYIGNTSVHTRAGDIFVIPPQVKHGFSAPKPLDIYIILIKSDFLSRYSEELNSLNGMHILFDIEPQIRSVSGKNYSLNLGYQEFDSVKADIVKMIKAEKEHTSVDNTTASSAIPIEAPVPMISTNTEKDTNIATTTPKINFCRNCGEKLIEGSKFCRNCGTRIEES